MAEKKEEPEETLEDALKRIGVYSHHRKDHNLDLMVAVVKSLGWHCTPTGHHFGLPQMEPQDVEDWILAAIGMEKKGDNGVEPCWSTDQRTYAQALMENLPSLLSEFPRKLEFFKEGYHDADGIAYDLGVQRNNQMRRAVSKERSDLRDRIRVLEQMLGGYKLTSLIRQLKQVTEALEESKKAVEGD